LARDLAEEQHNECNARNRGTRALAFDVEAGKSYWWCACGRSKKQPFCDGSHKGTQFAPVEWKASRPSSLVLCLQAHGKRPMCDGSHKKL